MLPGVSCIASGATVLVLQFHNASRYQDLTWVGESVSETLRDEYGSQRQIVFSRELREEAEKRLSLRPGAEYTKATLIRLGRTLDADYVYYGSFDATLPTSSTALKDSSIQISSHVIDLRKVREGPDLAEAGKLSDLSRLEEHLAWQSLHYVDPSFNLPLEAFLAPAKLHRADAEESYIRGLLSSNKDQQQKWFMQALALEPKFANPAFELGRLALERKDFREALSCFQRVSASDPRYSEARFQMGLAAYGAADYGTSANYFRDVSKTYPLNEVFNNLGAAEEQLNQPAAAGDFRRALEGDPNDTTYLFNLGATLFRHNNFDEAEQRLQAVLHHDPNDLEARNLLGRAQRHEFAAPAKPAAPMRLKTSVDISAFRQLKAVIQSKGS
jgi:tetratricopeptide (TPR) repeat protein